MAQTAIVPIDPPAAAAQESQQVPDPAPAKAAVSTPRPNVAAEPSTNTAARPAAVVPVAAPASSPGSPVVQVAAMSHQEDADVVAVDLKRRGYTVAIRREPQDKLFHVQIGPFATKKEVMPCASASRQTATITQSSNSGRLHLGRQGLGDSTPHRKQECLARLIIRWLNGRKHLDPRQPGKIALLPLCIMVCVRKRAMGRSAPGSPAKERTALS